MAHVSSHPMLSAVVPAYNAAPFLPALFESIQSQDVDDFEIVCVDDGSTDATADIIRTAAAQDPRIRLVSQINQGPSAARNAGIAAARGTYLCFPDSDDRFLPGAFSAMVATMQDTHADVAVFGATPVPQEASYPWLDAVLSPRDTEYNYLTSDVLLHEASRPFAWRCCARASFVKEYHIQFPLDLRYGEDQVFMLSLYAHASKIVFRSTKVYEYHMVREGSLMSELRSDDNAFLQRQVVIVEHVFNEWDKDDALHRYAGIALSWMADFVVYDIFRINGANTDELLGQLAACLKLHAASLESGYSTLSSATATLVNAAFLGRKPHGVGHALRAYDQERFGTRGALRMAASRMRDRLRGSTKAMVGGSNS